MVGNVCRVQGSGSSAQYGNLSKNSHKIPKKIRKNWGMVVMMVGNVCKVQGSGSSAQYGNLSKNSHKIAIKSEKFGGWCSLLVMMFRNIYRVQGPFPNMVIY